MTAALELPPPDVALAAARAAPAALADARLWPLSDAELTAVVAEAGAVVAQAQAVLLRLVGEADARQALLADGAASSSAWLRHRLRVSRSTISNVERGLPRGYNVLFLWRVAEGLAVPLGSVIDTAMRDLSRERQAERLSRRPHLGLAPRRS